MDSKMLKLYEITEGTVVKIEKTVLYLDLQCGAKGLIHLDNYDKPAPKTFEGLVQLGQKIKARIQKISDSPDQVLLSRIPLIIEERFEKIQELVLSKEMVKTKVRRILDKGLILYHLDFEIILPFCLLESNSIEDKNSLIGKVIEIQIIYAKEYRSSIVVGASEKVIEKIRQELYDHGLQYRHTEDLIDDILEGIVDDYGYIDIFEVTDAIDAAFTNGSGIIEITENYENNKANFKVIDDNINKAYLYINNDSDDIRNDWVKSFSHFKIAADLGSPIAQFEIARLYELGWGIFPEFLRNMRDYTNYFINNLKLPPKDYHNAYFWYNKAANQKYVRAYAYIGCLLLDGNGCDQDIVKGKKYIEEALQTDDLDARTLIANRYLWGKNIDEDLAKGLKILKECAENAHPEAQFDLGRMYYEGHVATGVNRNESYKWLMRAKANKYEHFKLDEMLMDLRNR